MCTKKIKQGWLEHRVSIAKEVTNVSIYTHHFHVPCCIPIYASYVEGGEIRDTSRGTWVWTNNTQPIKARRHQRRVGVHSLNNHIRRSFEPPPRLFLVILQPPSNLDHVGWHKKLLKLTLVCNNSIQACETASSGYFYHPSVGISSRGMPPKTLFVYIRHNPRL